MKKCQTIEIRTFLKFIEVPIKPIMKLLKYWINRVSKLISAKNQGSTSSSLLIYKHQKKKGKYVIGD